MGPPLTLYEHLFPKPVIRGGVVLSWSSSTWCSSLTSFLFPSICYYGRLFWEWGDGIRVHDSQKPQDPDKLSKEDVLSFIHAHSA